MNININFKISLILLGIITITSNFLIFSLQTIGNFSDSNISNDKLIVYQGNSLSSSLTPNNPDPNIEQEFKVIITAYSSTVSQTDDSPFITASNTYVQDGIVANNMLPFGTKIKIPELYGDKIFVVEDRMNRKKSPYHIDIWLPSYWEAKNFGVESTYIQVLEN